MAFVALVAMALKASLAAAAVGVTVAAMAMAASLEAARTAAAAGVAAEAAAMLMHHWLRELEHEISQPAFFVEEY